MDHNSITLHRVLQASQEKIYRAFTDANAMASWIHPLGIWSVYDFIKLTLYQGINQYFDFYNNERLHQSLDYQTPDQWYSVDA